jgi:hypothetical protein
VTTDYDPRRRRPYKTGELARIFGVDRNTIIKWIERDELFGREGHDWWWTAAGRGKGDRMVAARAVNRVLERGS